MPKRLVLVTGPSLNEAAVDLLQGNNCEVVFGGAYQDHITLLAQIVEHKPSAIISRMGRIDAAAIAGGMPNLKVIAKHGVGVDNIDVDAATAHAIPVAIAVGANATSVAEHAMALILSITKRVTPLDKNLRQGKWDKPTYQGLELAGMTLGFLGMGMIARATARMASQFGLHLFGYDPFISDDVFHSLKVQKCHSVDELFARSQILSLHAPLTPTTKGIINETAINQMPDGALIVNTARVGLVDEYALLSEIRTKRLSGAWLDSFAKEPLDPNHPFITEPNITITPHIGGVTAAANRRVALKAASNVLAVLDGTPIDINTIINREVLADRAMLDEPKMESR